MPLRDLCALRGKKPFGIAFYLRASVVNTASRIGRRPGKVHFRDVTIDEGWIVVHGHMLHAFRTGTPPHGGIAWGLDRLLMLLLNEPNIREVIAFPKTQTASCLLTNAPSPTGNTQLNELGIRLAPTVTTK